MYKENKMSNLTQKKEANLPHGNTGKQHPERWAGTKDPVRHKMYKTFVQQRNQANFRKEGWTLVFDEWADIWEASGKWEQKGRRLDDFCSTRKDHNQAWTKDNFIIMSRREFMSVEGVRRGQIRWEGYERTEAEYEDYLARQKRHQARKALRELNKGAK